MAGSIHKYKTKNGRDKWFYMLDLGKDEKGKRKQKKKSGFKSEREAKKALTLAQADVYKGTYLEPSKMPFRQYLDEWFNTKKKSISRQTIDVYRLYLDKYIIPFLGDITLTDLKTIHINKFINNMHDRDYSASTIKKAMNIIKNALEHAIDTELINKNIAKKATLPKENKVEITVWNEEEVNSFLKVAKQHRHYPIFYLALTTGMRQGEILGLRWRDIDFYNHSLTINQVLSHDGKEMIKGAKTKTSNRTIDLSDSTIKILKTHKKIIIQEKLNSIGYQDFDLVFCTPIGTPVHPSNLRNRTFNKLIEKAKIPKIRFHDLRHTHATLLLSKGVNIKVISERLGHSNIRITLDTYSHMLPTMQKDAIEKLDSMINI